jgi:hypothetical protein
MFELIKLGLNQRLVLRNPHEQYVSWSGSKLPDHPPSAHTCERHVILPAAIIS